MEAYGSSRRERPIRMGRFSGQWVLRTSVLALSLAAITGCSMQKGATSYAQAPAATKATFIPVEGMSCGSCAANVKRAVKGMNGVTQVEVSLEQRGVKVHYVGSKVTPEQMAATITQAGYKAGTPRPER